MQEMQTDFNNYFIVAFRMTCRKLEINLSPLLQYVAALPSEILVSNCTTFRQTHSIQTHQ